MVTRTLTELTSTEFENLVFDLMTAHGMLNVTWRTPGADGGRDIEGTVVQNDFSLTQNVQKWYVECKRYEGSVDWSTIYSKVAFAHSNAADVLLMCTSSKYTPTALNEVTKWNNTKNGPIIRLWPGHQIETLLSNYQDIAWKYGLKNAPLPITGSTLQLTLALSKCVTSHCSSLEFSNLGVPPMLCAAQAISGLLQAKMESAEKTGTFERVIYPIDKFDIASINLSSDLKHVDGPSFKAFIAYLTALNIKILSISNEENYACKITCLSTITDTHERYKSVFDSISLWGNFEYRIDDKQIFIKQR